MFNKNKFKGLVEEAKGDRSISQYSRESDVSRTYISQAINKTLDSPPNPDILRRLAHKAKNGIKYRDLMLAAGYLQDIIFEEELPSNAIPFNPDDMVKIPIVGCVSCGVPLLAEENIIGYELVDKNSINGGTYFYLKATGDSMIGARIYEGDLVLVRKQQDIENGEIAIVLVAGEEATLKRVYKKGYHIVLQAENQKYEPMIYRSDEIEVIGKVIEVKFKF